MLNFLADRDTNSKIKETTINDYQSAIKQILITANILSRKEFFDYNPLLFQHDSQLLT
ncbi:Uncharacterised protein [Yersinia nurmii]|uniref:Integrase n=1 Tax=Yersinia nurmii TaxID=685706 RepID=A0ABM9S585_9GAMM|nr:Uncharacterised protein [Yersinia nurmii]